MSDSPFPAIFFREAQIGLITGVGPGIGWAAVSLAAALVTGMILPVDGGASIGF